MNELITDEYVANLTEKDFAEPDVYHDLMSIEDGIERTFAISRVSERAQKLKKKTLFMQNLKLLQKELKEQEQLEIYTGIVMGVTNFTLPDGATFANVKCGRYDADDRGVSIPTDGRHPEQWIVRHPILPTERYKVVETGEESVRIDFCRNNRWEHFTVPKETIASNTKIISLANRGVGVTSENAKRLVQFLSEVEAFNEEVIPVTRSTIKLGWHDNDFVPYKTDLVMDESNASLRPIQEAIKEPKGDFDTWLKHVKMLRKLGNKELRIMMAASFASPLIEMFGTLPFFVDLWGDTEGGKTVALMIATSIWANPAESQYIKDYTSTTTALEVTADFLNNLPMVLDDTSKRGTNKEKSFEDLVYMLTNGQGRNRSNKDLGLRRTAEWSLCILTNGERPLSDYVRQGGAINRILEVRCPQKLFEDPHGTTDIVRQNYGHAGRLFIEELIKIGKGSALKTFDEKLKKIHDISKMQKQEMSMAAILTADKIATDYIFKDGIYLSTDEIDGVLTDGADVSDNERCYNYLLEMLEMNKGHFAQSNDFSVDHWGEVKEQNGRKYIDFVRTAFDRLCAEEGYSPRSFLEWADAKGLLFSDNGRKTKVVKENGRASRHVCIWTDPTAQESEFMEVDMTEFESKVPF